MTRWRVLTALVLLALVGLPVAMPFVSVLANSHAWQTWSEAERLLSLARSTLQLVVGTLLVCLPIGVVGAFILYRTDLPWRRGLRFLTFLTLFVPLPLFTSAWQATLGTSGFLPVAFWTNPVPGDPDISPAGTAMKPWGRGLGSAIWVHALAGLPWVVVLVGQALLWVERELEEDALLVAGPWRVLWKVTLPRCRAAILAAGLWVALMTMTEITVTDMMKVRTYAEEVYTQLVETGPEAQARAVAVSLPAVMSVAGLALWASRRWEKGLPPLERLEAPPRLVQLGKARWLILIGISLFIGIFAGVPLVSLLWKTGLSGAPEAWSAHEVGTHLDKVVRVNGLMILQSFFLAAGAGAFTASLALIVCWLALGSRWFRTVTLGLMALVWALPGPVLGLGMKDAISNILDVIPLHPLRVALYDGPSLLPVAWADMIRFFPCAVAVLWPVLRLFPIEMREAARVDGARPLQELLRVVVPLTASAWLRAGFAVMVLSLGELSAGKLVATPGAMTFAQTVFVMMHNGVKNDLAALCLILLAVVILSGSLFAALSWRRGSRAGEEEVCDV